MGTTPNLSYGGWEHFNVQAVHVADIMFFFIKNLLIFFMGCISEERQTMAESSKSRRNTVQEIDKERNNIHNVLPVEIMSRIFSMMDGIERKTVVQVCKNWRSVCEQQPSLWTWVTITVDKFNADTVKAMVKVKRLEALRNLILEDLTLTKDLLRDLMRWNELDYLKMENIDFGPFDWELLAC